MARILITGTSKGIGYDATLHLARRGHSIVATMRNPAKSDLADVVAKEELPVEILTMDVDNDDSVNTAFSEAGDIDVLINNAGILSHNAIEDEPVNTFAAVMNTNYLGTIRCCKAAIPRMRERKAGKIINMSSVAGQIAAGAQSAYAGSKHALWAFSQCLAQEMLPFGVQVFVVAPGIIHTPMASTELPRPRSNSAYANGRRIMALFEMASHGEAPPVLVSDKLSELIEQGSDRFHHPVGPDSLIFLGYRLNTGVERFINTWGHPDDDEFVAQVKGDMMMDLGPFLKR